MAAEFWRKAKEMTRNAQYAISGRSEVEKMVLEATNDEKWGPSNTQMQEISRLTFNYQDCESIKKVIWERLGQTEEVRYVQKALLLLEYLIRTGHESMRSEARTMNRQLQSLSTLHRYDVGEQAAFEAVIRKKAADIMKLASDNELYQAEREKATKLKSKVGAVGNSGGFGGSYGGSSYGGSYGGSSYGNNYGSSTSYGNNYDSYEMPSKRKQKEVAPKPSNDDEYEYEYEEEPAAQPAKPKAQPAAPAQQAFDPFAPVQQPAQQAFDPFAPVQQPAQQAFDPFAGIPAAQPAKPSAPAGGFLPPPPGMKPRAQPAASSQQPFDPFGNSQPAAAPAPAQDSLLDFGFGSPAPAKPAPAAPAQNNLLDFGFGAPAQPAPAAPAQSANLFDDLMGFGGPAAPAQPAAAPIQPAPAAKPKSNMFGDLGDLVDLNNAAGGQRTYGSVAQTQRGRGQSLGNLF